MRRRYILWITAPIVMTSFVLMLVGGAAAWYVHQLNKEVSLLLARNLECTLACEQVVLGIRDARLQMLRFLDTGDDANLQVVETIERQTADCLQEAERMATADEIRDAIHRMRQKHEWFFIEFASVRRAEPSAARQQQVRESIQTIGTDLLAPAEQLLHDVEEASAAESRRNQTLADHVGLGLLLLGTCGAVAGMLAGFGIARGIARRIEQSEREALRAEQLAGVGQLAAGLAHELRNPLTAIRLLVEAGRNQVDGSPLDDRDLAVLDEEIARLEKLVQSFLDFARTPQLEKTKFDARGLIDQTLHLVGGPARQRGVAMDYRPPTEPVLLDADPMQIRQVLLNLLLNALDAAGEGGQVRVELLPGGGAADDHENGRGPAGKGHRRPEKTCVIRVSDDGPGVPDDMRERIFLPFVSGKETGLGLGLAVSRRIIEAHHGDVMVDGAPEGGARFSVRLPLIDASLT